LASRVLSSKSAVRRQRSLQHFQPIDCRALVA
jgi:hypothetical protein